MHYFAYGSNMLHARLGRRVRGARPLGAACLRGYNLRFHMRGSDGSGKCNAHASGRIEDEMYGVVFAVDENRLSRLHAAEGPGYQFTEVRVEIAGETTTAFAYLARSAWLDDALAPFAWYHALVVAGAKEHALPEAYIAKLDNVFTRTDPRLGRRLRNRWILRGNLR